ncbi:MAG: hypothetical protein KAH57_12075, partial [Thermoplasmata archaeon]|nr:hypothetical protein [Thermoplasmata archaeon]
VNSANLSFYHKYNMERGSNGGVILIGTSATEDGVYRYRYIQPDQPYTGNILMTEWPNNEDDFGYEMKWCWNGISSGGTLDWEHVTVNLEDFTMGGTYEANFIKVMFHYIYAYGGTGYGWILDDVKLDTTSNSDNANKYDTLDHWKLKEVETGFAGNYSHSGNYSLFCGDDSKLLDDKGDFLSGIDNSIYTRPIDLTNAKSAHLSAYFKFNFDNNPGRPPDGFRVEVSSDNGISWIPLSLGVRSSWGVSGSEVDGDDGVVGDGKSYTGLYNDHHWVSADSLSRLITDMSGFIGSVIILRFRVITNTDLTHYEALEHFKGFYMDDIIIYGESLETSRGSPDVRSDEEIRSMILSDPESSLEVKEDPPDIDHQADIGSQDPVTHESVQEPMDGKVGSNTLFWAILLIAPFIMALFPIVVRKRYL